MAQPRYQWESFLQREVIFMETLHLSRDTGEVAHGNCSSPETLSVNNNRAPCSSRLSCSHKLFSGYTE